MRGRKDIPGRLWARIVASMPIACVDIIAHRRISGRTHVLLGYRKIYPYNDRWAFPGGRIIKNESLRDTADRQLEEVGLHATGDYRLVGVYPVNFKRRSDIAICLSTYLPWPEEPSPTKELVRYTWRPLDGLPARLGSNYRTMVNDFNAGRYRVR